MATGDLDARRARALVPRVVEQVFGEKPRRVKRLGEGLTNAVFEVGVGRDRWVVRLHADSAKVAAFAKECWAMQQARRAGVPTPKVARAGLGPDGVAFLVVAAVPGQTGSRVGHRQPLLEQMGRCAARLHGIATRGFGGTLDVRARRWSPHAHWAGVLDDELDADARIALLRRQDVLPADALEELRESVQAMRRWRRTPVLHHGDLRLKNVIADEEGRRIAAIIDWEDCLSAPKPYWDLSIALHDLGVDEKEVFLDGYGISAREFARMAGYVRALNLLNYAWAMGEAEKERNDKRLAWMKLRLAGGLDITP
jgi:hygromycin-B 4-O-kinase